MSLLIIKPHIMQPLAQFLTSDLLKWPVLFQCQSLNYFAITSWMFSFIPCEKKASVAELQGPAGESLPFGINYLALGSFKEKPACAFFLFCFKNAQPLLRLCLASTLLWRLLETLKGPLAQCFSVYAPNRRLGSSAYIHSLIDSSRSFHHSISNSGFICHIHSTICSEMLIRPHDLKKNINKNQSYEL